MPEKEKTAVKNEEGESTDDDDLPIASTRSKPIKKDVAPKREEVDDDDDEDNVPLAISRAKKKSPAGGSAASKGKKDGVDSEEKSNPKKTPLRAKVNAKASKVKKEEPEDSYYSEEESDKKKRTTQKKEEVEKVAKRKRVKKEADVEGTEGKVKKERKVYDLPGQKHDPPEERDPLRIFYESLYQQVPSSEMAAIWLMEWGLLPAKEAEEIYEKKQMKNGSLKLRSPTKVVSIKKTTNVTVKTEKTTTTKTVVKTQKKRKASDSEDDDDDFVLSKSKKRKVSA